MIPVLVVTGLVTLLATGSGTAGRSASGPRASRDSSATVPAGVTITRTDSQQAVTSPSPYKAINVAAYEACLAAGGGNTPGPIVTSLAGWSDVSKLGEAEAPGFPVPASASNPPGEGFVSTSTTAGGVSYSCDRANVDLDYQGQREFPPVRATFTAFGFEPVTATAYLTQDDATPLTAVDYLDIDEPFGTSGNGPNGAVATANVQLRLADVTVSGTPLDVGSDCRTAGPLTSPDSPVDPDMLVLAGGNQPGDFPPVYDLTDGGDLAGDADIPSFTGCVTPSGENVDALLDATVSGPDNLLQMEQGPACIQASAGTDCAGSYEPRPGPLWTITDGGSYTSTSTEPLTLDFRNVLEKGLLVNCTGSTVAGTVPDADGPPRGAQMTFGWTSVSGCTGTLYAGTAKKPTITPDGTWTVTMETPSADLYTYTPSTGTVAGVLENTTLDLDGTGLTGTPASCSMQAAGTPGLSYTDSSSELSVGEASNSGSLFSITSSDCTATGTAVSNTVPIAVTYTLSRPMQITSP